MGFLHLRLGDVCRLINGRAYKKKEMLNDGPYPLLRVGNFFTNREWYYSDLELDEDKYCDNGDLLYAWSASFGPRIWDGEKVIYHYHIWKVDLNRQLVDKKYLYYLLDWDKDRIKQEQGAGTTMIHVTKGSMEARVLPFPPIPEQKHIVAILDQAFADIDRAREITERNLHNIRELFESYLQQVFSQPGEGWSMVQLGSVCEIEKIKYKGNALPYVGMEDIEGRTGRFLGSLSPAEVASSTFQFTDEHLLYGRLRPYLNKVLTPDFTGHCSSEIFPLRPKSELDRKFLFYWLSSERVVQAIDKTCTGARMPRANVKEVLTFNIPLPPIPEQKRIVTILDQVFTDSDRARELNEKKLESLNELKKSLLQKAFSGELTGDQPGAAA